MPKSVASALRRVRVHWPLIVASAVFAILLLAELAAAVRETDGHLIYTLDDAYIHMAMAKNLVLHGVYGATPFEFSSSSSSPLWTLVVALFFLLFGVHEIVPFILNALLALAVLAFLAGALRRANMGNPAIALVLLGTIFLTPLPAMVFSGMEHLLQTLLVLLFVWFTAHALMSPGSNGKTISGLLALTGALVLVRYESYALLATACLLFLVRRRWFMTLALGLAGLLPLIVYQAISVSHGWSWLPNSILIRTGLAGAATGQGSNVASAPAAASSAIERFATLLIQKAGAGVHVLSLVALVCVLLMIPIASKRPRWTEPIVMAALFVCTAIAHILFGHVGHFFRYEAYLVALGIFVVALLLPDSLPVLRHRIGRAARAGCTTVIVLAGCCAMITLIDRAGAAWHQTPVASRNIYEQQYQMGRFLGRYYRGEPVAVNDIGAVSYLSDIRLLDLVGLASADVFHLKNAGRYNSGALQTLCSGRGIKVAILYDVWFQRGGFGGVPSGWTKAGEWRITDNVICSDDVVALYAVDRSELDSLLFHLREFAGALPQRVVQSGMYTNAARITECAGAPLQAGLLKPSDHAALPESSAKLQPPCSRAN